MRSIARRSFGDWRVLLSIVAALAYLGVKAWTPVALLAFAAYDDAWFMRAAESIGRGEWLGPYNELTLIKGAGYPLFLAFGSWLGLSSTVWTALFHIVAVAALAVAILHVTRSRWASFVFFLLVLWHPIGWTFPLLRVIRDTVYPEQLMLALALAVGALFGARRWTSVAFALLAGLCLGWFWETREESIWMVPGLALLLLGAWALARRPRIQWFALLVLAASVGFGTVEGAIRWANHRHYGTWVDVEFREPNFRRALETLQSVRDVPAVPKVPVPKSLRRLLYEVSPSMASLEPWLDPPGEPVWQWGCEYSPWTCGDIAGGWFMWALREAAAKEGHYASPTEAAEFYRRLSSEVEAACRSGRFTCESNWIPFMPASGWSHSSEIGRPFAAAVPQMLLSIAPDLEPLPSAGYASDIEHLTSVLLKPRISSQETPRFEVSGWYYRRGGGWPLAAVSNSSGESLRAIALPQGASPDLANALQDPAADRQRFRFTVEGGATSVLTFSGENGAEKRISIAEIAPGRRRVGLGDGVLYFDGVVDLEDSGRTDPRALAGDRTRARVLRFYRVTLPLILVGGGAALLLAIIFCWRTRRLTSSLVLATSLAALTACRILLLALIEISSFPAMHFLYMAPAFYLSVAAAVLAMQAAVDSVRGGRRKARDDWSWMGLRSARRGEASAVPERAGSGFSAPAGDT